MIMRTLVRVEKCWRKTNIDLHGEDHVLVGIGGEGCGGTVPTLNPVSGP